MTMPAAPPLQTAIASQGGAWKVSSPSYAWARRAFGGPVAHLGYFRREFVLRRRWLDEAAYADLVALAQFLPGRRPAKWDSPWTAASGRAGRRRGLSSASPPPPPCRWLLFAYSPVRSWRRRARAGPVHGLQRRPSRWSRRRSSTWPSASAAAPRRVALITSLAAALFASSSTVSPSQAAALVARREPWAWPGSGASLSGARRVGAARAVPPHRRRLPRHCSPCCAGQPAARAVRRARLAMAQAFYRSDGLVFGRRPCRGAAAGPAPRSSRAGCRPTTFLRGRRRRPRPSPAPRFAVGPPSSAPAPTGRPGRRGSAVLADSRPACRLIGGRRAAFVDDLGGVAPRARRPRGDQRRRGRGAGGRLYDPIITGSVRGPADADRGLRGPAASHGLEGAAARPPSASAPLAALGLSLL